MMVDRRESGMIPFVCIECNTSLGEGKGSADIEGGNTVQIIKQRPPEGKCKQSEGQHEDESRKGI